MIVLPPITLVCCDLTDIVMDAAVVERATHVTDTIGALRDLLACPS